MADLDPAGEYVASVLDKLASRLFTPDMRLTFLAVDPSDPEKDFCVTSLSGDDLVAAAERVRVRAGVDSTEG